MDSKKHIVVVGAGPGGLSAAMLLAHRGFDVTVVEKHKQVGGRNGQLKIGKYSFDIGPTFLMMKFILDQVFMETGRKAEDYMKFTRLDPMYHLVFPDREMDVYQDKKKMKQELQKHFPEDAEGVMKFHEQEHKRFQAMIPCLQMDYSGWKKMLKPRLLKALPYLSIGKSLFGVMGSYFKNEQAKLSFTFQSKYLGMSPWECPGAFSIIPYIEHAFGIYHVEKGLSEISRAMARVVKEDGGKILLNTPVKQVMVKDGEAKGVLLENGKRIIADTVVMNADFGYAMTNLMPKGSTKYTQQKLEKKKWSCSTFMLYLGLKKRYPLKHHTIVFADDYRQNIQDVFKGDLSGSNISYYVRNGVVNDPTEAPKGHSALYVLVPAPNKQGDANWKKEKKRMRDFVINSMKNKLGLKDIEKHIEVERIITPDDWEGGLNVFLGATFNLSHNLTQMLTLRPHNKFECVDKMYLVGGGTHPGSGLPTIYESGRIVANMISRRFKKEFFTYNVYA